MTVLVCERPPTGLRRQCIRGGSRNRIALPKIKYATWREADQAVMDSADYFLLQTYRCGSCGLWHVGKTPTKRGRR